MKQPESPSTLAELPPRAEVAIASNRLLAALPDSELAHWLPHLQLVDLSLGQVVSEQRDDAEVEQEGGGDDPG